ncbi:DUF6545 domain-containing protein [Streptomyces sp. NPDC045251]|uniref:DUF6545 domain-containing protein n=1 Tax=unclassified Streptomyces TaxID=2593676 RepID=UPI003404D3DF
MVNLTIAVITLILGITKALAARHEPGATLKLTASVLLHAGVIFLLATPPIYRATGQATNSANLPALGIDVATLICVGHAHYMTLLWHPQRHTPAARRQALKAWLPFYITAVAAMVILYALADLPGAARPLHFAPFYADAPAVFALKVVYFAALIVAVIATMIQCRQVALPDRPELAQDVRRCMQWFALAVGLDLATAAFTLTAMISVVTSGGHRLDFLADASWVATILSGIAANQSLGRLVLATTRSDRQDCRTLKPLWKLVVEGQPDLVIPTAWWEDSRIKLDRMMIETLDGSRTLKPWMNSEPSKAVEDLLAEQEAGDRPHRPAIPPADLAVVQAAATLRYAAQRRARTQEPAPQASRLTELPGINVPEDEQQAYLVKIAQYLAHPLVREALQRTSASEPADIPAR